MPVEPGGTTRNYCFPAQDFPEVTAEIVKRRFEGLVGGWLPVVRKIFPISENAYVEALIFGDVEAHDEFIVQTWHRTARFENGKMVKAVYGYSYPLFPPVRLAPKPEDFYRGLLVCAAYWDRETNDFCKVVLPEEDYLNLARHAFVRELMVRPRGVYPKYGAVDRNYYGPETDGFQDTFTSSVYANLELGRFEMAKTVIDNFFTQFLDSQGMINMRGPETAQFGLTLSLLAPTSFEVMISRVEAKQAINYGLEKVRFVAPVRAGKRVRNRVKVASIEERGNGRMLLTTENTVEIEGEDRPAVTAFAQVMLMS